MILGFKSRDESCSLCNKYKYAAIVELVKPLEEILKELERKVNWTKKKMELTDMILAWAGLFCPFCKSKSVKLSKDEDHWICLNGNKAWK